MAEGLSLNRPDRVAIIGGGWAGLACAVELAEAGVPVSLFEAAKHLGGRARSVAWPGHDDASSRPSIQIDNGQHILIGAYSATLRLLEKLGATGSLSRHPLRLETPPYFHLKAPNLPAPLHLASALLFAHGLTWSDRLSAMRFINHLKQSKWRLTQDEALTNVLKQHRQSSRLCDWLWEPLCLAALNTPLHQASAQVFCHVLRDSLGGNRAASDLLLPAAPLGQLVPDRAAEYLQVRGHPVHLGRKVERVRRQYSESPLFSLDDHVETYRHVVCATHPARVSELVADLPELESTRAQLSALAWQPIATLWLRFSHAPRLPFAMLGLDCRSGGPGQWLFDRSDLAPGLVSVVISAEGDHLEMSPSALLAAILKQLEFVDAKFGHVLEHKLITEKRATFACTPNLNRPDNQTPLPGLYLAGDYTASDYPATLESAVRSGVKCAERILSSLAS